MKKVGLYLMALCYVLSGINHFVHPAFYMAIMPLWLPFPLKLIYISGVLEMLFAVCLIPAFTRRYAAQCIILLLIAVFPANVQNMLNSIHQHDPYTWFTIARLPVQLILIAWAWIYTKRKPDKI